MKRGFTIIEIVVSVLIIAIVTLTLAKVNKQNANSKYGRLCNIKK